MPGGYTPPVYRIVEFEPNRFKIEYKGWLGIWFTVQEHSYAGNFDRILSSFEEAEEFVRSLAKRDLERKQEKAAKAKFVPQVFEYNSDGKAC